MAWYHDEANAQNKIDLANAEKRKIIQHSNFWVSLKQQIDTDVRGINETVVWAKRMGGFTIAVEPCTEGDGYRIHKAGSPSLTVTLKHQGDHVEVKRDFAGHSLGEKYPDESLEIDSQGRNVVLKKDKTRFTVPEQAAKYLLTPFIELLKTVDIDSIPT